ncbi:MAG: prenyltransferase/squalene oxidase repeat-containing protein [Planctomycetota bacterium]
MIAFALLASLTASRPESITPADIDRAIARGTTLLVERQESLDGREVRGEWPYEGVYRERGQIPIGYRVGGTAIGGLALLAATESSAAEPAQAALERALDFVLEALREPRMASGFAGSYDVRGWGHAYALGFLLELARAGRVPTDKRERVAEETRALIRTLQETEIEGRGGWNYARGERARPSTFMTASTLLALFEARRQGFVVDDEVVERALDALASARLETGAFQYSSNPERVTGEGFEDVRGSTGRSPVCELVLHLAGRGSPERIRSALAQFFEHWEWLEKRRKQTGTHVPPYMIAPYYFFYAHRYAAQAIEQLPEAERAPLRARLHELVWKVREEDGGWNDRVFPRSACFGTSMVVLALAEPKRAAPAGWKRTAPDAPAPAGSK